jgi:hypothetical protein
VSPDIQYVEVLTYPTQNLYYSIGNEGTFLTWLNYVISQSSIPLAGSGETRRTRLPKDYAKGTSLLAGGYGVGLEATSLGPFTFHLAHNMYVFLSLQISHIAQP